MAKYLFKLGNWAVEHGKKIIAVSVAILVALAVVALIMGPAFEENMSIPGTESEQAMKTVEKAFPQPDNTGGEIQVIFKAPKNETLESANIVKAITETLNEIKKDKAVEATALPAELGNISENKRIGYAAVTYKVPAGEVTESSKEKILKSIEISRDAGIQTELAGSVAFSGVEVGGITEVLGVAVAFIVLAITFTSFLAAGMPILTAAIGVGMGLLLIMIGTNIFEITSFSLTLAAMLGLAVGIDYTLFIISRFRQQLAEGYSVKDSVAIATGTAGSAVVFAGVTVIVALLGLAVADIPFLTAMGISAAVCVLIAILIAVIVVPAVLGMLGHKVGPARKNAFLQKMTRSGKKPAGSNKWGEFVTKRPLLVTIFGIIMLAVVAVPFFHMELGLPDNGTKPEDTMERRAYDLLSEAYGPGYHAPLVIAAQTTDKTPDSQNALNEIVQELGEMSNVKSVTPAIPSPSGKLFLINMTPETGPNDTETKDLVQAIRDKGEALEKENHIKLMVTGATAVNIDIAQKLNDALPPFALLIVGFAFVLLAVVFRSILVPLKAVLGFLLSLGATLGFCVFVIQDGNLLGLFDIPAAGPVLCFLPVIVVGILFGLAMDYEVFLVSRMREVYVHTGNARKAILMGMKDSGGVVTAAGLIMISVFAGFMLAPDPIIKQMGLALTFGVLFDAFIVRMAIVPAVMILMGDSAWYLPKWLDKILPDLDIEGESVMKDFKDKQRSTNSDAV